MREHFADPVESYWGRRDVRIDEVVQDKVAYARKWVFRFYRLQRETLVVRPSTGRRDTFEVTFSYDFIADRVPPRSSGVGETTLVLEIKGDKVRILAENGRILERHRGTQ